MHIYIYVFFYLYKLCLFRFEAECSLSPIPTPCQTRPSVVYSIHDITTPPKASITALEMRTPSQWGSVSDSVNTP